MSHGINKKFGFGIIEVLLSGVIIITILGALVFAARNIINNTTYSQQRVQAVFLAQDAIEHLRQIRDTNYIDGVSDTKWNTITGEYSALIPSIGTMYCLRKKLHNPLKRYHIIQCTVREINKDNGTEVVVDETNFYVYIYFSKVGEDLLADPTIIGPVTDPDYAYIVKAEVEWTFLGKDKKLVIEELITNSRQAW